MAAAAAIGGIFVHSGEAQRPGTSATAAAGFWNAGATVNTGFATKQPCMASRSKLGCGDGLVDQTTADFDKSRRRAMAYHNTGTW